MPSVSDCHHLAFLEYTSNNASEQRETLDRWTPAVPFIENRGDQQLVNFDLQVENRGKDTYNLVAIKLSVFDRADKLEEEPPALNSVGERLFRPDAAIDIFQPFHAFDAALDLSRRHMELLFMQAAGRHLLTS